jgi:hypothetical protein
MLSEQNLATATRSSYKPAIQKYKDFMCCIERDEKNPSEMDIAEWIVYESLFISAASISHYLSAVRYYLDLGGKRAAVRGGGQSG